MSPVVSSLVNPKYLKVPTPCFAHVLSSRMDLVGLITNCICPQ